MVLYASVTFGLGEAELPLAWKIFIMMLKNILIFFNQVLRVYPHYIWYIILLQISDHCPCRASISICWKLDVFPMTVFQLYLETCSLLFLACSCLSTFLIFALFSCLCLNSFVISCWLMTSSRNGCCCGNGF